MDRSVEGRRLDGCVGGLVELTVRPMDVLADEQMGWVDGRKLRWVVGPVDEWARRCVGCWNDEWIRGWMGRRINACMNKCMGAWLVGRTHGSVGGWVSGWTDGWVEDRMCEWMVVAYS